MSVEIAPGLKKYVERGGKPDGVTPGDGAVVNVHFTARRRSDGGEIDSSQGECAAPTTPLHLPSLSHHATDVPLCFFFQIPIIESNL